VKGRGRCWYNRQLHTNLLRSRYSCTPPHLAQLAAAQPAGSLPVRSPTTTAQQPTTLSCIACPDGRAAAPRGCAGALMHCAQPSCQTPQHTRQACPAACAQKKTMETGSSQHDRRTARLDLENDRLLPAPCICMTDSCPAAPQAATRSTAQPKPRHTPRSAAPAAAAARETRSSERAAPPGTWSRGCSNVRATEAQA